MHGSFTGPRQLDVAAELALDGSTPTITVPDAGLLFRGDFKRFRR